MKKIIAGKQRKKPFDYDAGENFVLPKDADGMINNSYYFSAHNENTSFYCRLGIRSTHKEIWFYYSDQAVRLSFDDLNFKGDCPLVTVKDDKCWKVVYNGKAKDKNGVDVNVEFSADYTATEKAIDFFSHMPPVRTAMAMAGEKWNKEFFSEVQKNNQVHYEEFGVLNGTIKINGELKEFSLPCTRDHSFGKRDWKKAISVVG